jgi:hypothetical protein
LDGYNCALSEILPAPDGLTSSGVTPGSIKNPPTLKFSAT